MLLRALVGAMVVLAAVEVHADVIPKDYCNALNRQLFSVCASTSVDAEGAHIFTNCGLYNFGGGPDGPKNFPLDEALSVVASWKGTLSLSYLHKADHTECIVTADATKAKGEKQVFQKYSYGTSQYTQTKTFDGLTNTRRRINGADEKSVWIEGGNTEYDNRKIKALSEADLAAYIQGKELNYTLLNGAGQAFVPFTDPAPGVD